MKNLDCVGAVETRAWEIIVTESDDGSVIVDLRRQDNAKIRVTAVEDASGALGSGIGIIANRLSVSADILR